MIFRNNGSVSSRRSRALEGAWVKPPTVSALSLRGTKVLTISRVFSSPISQTYQRNGSACEFLRKLTPSFLIRAMYQQSEKQLVPLERIGCPSPDANLCRALVASPI